MCTLSWWREGKSYGVFFNRDESRKRLEAEAPSLFEGCRVSYLSPVDPDGGGTWIWVNNQGVIGCLLNNYAVKKNVSVNPVSRGLLLKALSSQRDTHSLFERVSNTELINFMGFYIFGMDSNGHGLVSWDCDRLQLLRQVDVHSPITTSGFLPEEISSHRMNLYHSRFDSEDSPSADDLISYHAFHDPDLPAHSVLMSRVDARTVSLSQISVGPKTIKFSYWTVSQQCSLSKRPHVKRVALLSDRAGR